MHCAVGVCAVCRACVRRVFAVCSLCVARVLVPCVGVFETVFPSNPGLPCKKPFGRSWRMAMFVCFLAGLIARWNRLIYSCHSCFLSESVPASDPALPGGLGHLVQGGSRHSGTASRAPVRSFGSPKFPRAEQQGIDRAQSDSHTDCIAFGHLRRLLGGAFHKIAKRSTPAQPCQRDTGSAPRQ